MIACPKCHRLRRPNGLHICLAEGQQRRLERAAPQLTREEIERCLARGARDASVLFEQLGDVFRMPENGMRFGGKA